MQTTAIVDSTSGAKVANTDKPFILMLHKGEDLFSAITRCTTDAKLKSAAISGLGALVDVNLAYYDIDKKEYHTKLFNAGLYELISLNGNVATVDGKHFLHLHCAIGTHDYEVFGGHLMGATVGAAGEITIIPLSAEIERAYDAETGLKLMQCPI